MAESPLILLGIPGGDPLSISREGYHADAVHFDGASYLEIASLAAANSANFACSVWLKTAGNQANGVPIWIADPDTQAAPTLQYFSNKLQLFLSDNAITTALDARTSALSNAVWNHILMGAKTDLSAGNKQIKLYLNDVDVTENINDADASFISEFNSFMFTAFGSAGSNPFTGDAADLWVATNQSILTAGDIPEATRRKFISAALKPVYLGASGELPTGIAPPVFFSGDATGFVTNRGSGGAATLVGGPLTNASTSPSD